MVPLVSPWQKTRWNADAVGWAAMRAILLGYAYPAGFPTTLVDTIETAQTTFTTSIPTTPSLDGITINVDRYTIAAPGGRSGGTPLYAWLVPPIVPAVGKLFVWLAGHITHSSSWKISYGGTISRALALGYHVLAIDMPDHGLQPNPQQIVIAGTLTTVVGHNYAALDSDGGPPSVRMFADNIIRATNQAIHDLAPTDLFLGGHSGGGWSAYLIGALDGRFSHVYPAQGGVPICTQTTPTFPATDWEQDWISPLYAIAGGDVGWLLSLAASWPGRRLYCGSADPDSEFPTCSYAQLTEYHERLNELLGRTTSRGTALYTVPNHNQTTAEDASSFADIELYESLGQALMAETLSDLGGTHWGWTWYFDHFRLPTSGIAAMLGVVDSAVWPSDTEVRLTTTEWAIFSDLISTADPICAKRWRLSCSMRNAGPGSAMLRIGSAGNTAFLGLGQNSGIDPTKLYLAYGNAPTFTWLAIGVDDTAYHQYDLESLGGEMFRWRLDAGAWSDPLPLAGGSGHVTMGVSRPSGGAYATDLDWLLFAVKK